MIAKITSILMIFLVPSWLYASGNIPYLIPDNSAIVKAVNDSSPRLASFTYRQSHRVLEKLRKSGIKVPYTYNERTLKITRMREKVIKICNSILSDR